MLTNKSSNFRQEFDKIANFCSRAKTKMLKEKYVAAKNKCPWCEGTWHFRIVGSRNHLHASCDGTCKKMFME